MRASCHSSLAQAISLCGKGEHLQKISHVEAAVFNLDIHYEEKHAISEPMLPKYLGFLDCLFGCYSNYSDYLDNLGKSNFFTLEERVDHNKNVILNLSKTIDIAEKINRYISNYASLSNARKVDGSFSYYNRGIMYYAIAEFKKAIDDFIKAIQLSEKNHHQDIDFHLYCGIIGNILLLFWHLCVLNQIAQSEILFLYYCPRFFSWTRIRKMHPVRKKNAVWNRKKVLLTVLWERYFFRNK